MCTREVEMGFTSDRFNAGTHMCLVYNSENERRKIIAKFIEAGLSSGEKVFYFADTADPGFLEDWFDQMGIRLPDPDQQGNLDLSPAQDVYCPTGEFVPAGMLATLEETIANGFPGARVSGEMTWALRGIPGSDRLMEYEAQVNNVLAKAPVTAICQYDANRFSGSQILDVLKVHPMMIVRGQIVQNPYYIRPEQFLSEYHRVS